MAQLSFSHDTATQKMLLIFKMIKYAMTEPIKKVTKFQGLQYLIRMSINLTLKLITSISFHQNLL
jgi:hypothetical protein